MRRKALATVPRRALTAGEIALNLDELSQPLTAILATARALQRTFLKSPAVDPEVTEAVADVTGQAFRAAKIVHRMRKIVQRREARRPRRG
jgi:hypothetical protein